MKIAVISRNFPNSAAPWLGRSIYETIRMLARKADVQVFCPHARYPRLLKPRSAYYEEFYVSYSLPDVKAKYYLYPAIPLVSRPFNGWMSARALLADVRNFAPDVIFGCFLYPSAFAALQIGKALSVPVVARGMGSDINRTSGPILAMHTRTVLREADFLVMVSDDLRRKAVAMGASPEKIRTVLNGCDVSIFHPMDRLEARQRLRIDPASEAAVYIGRMDVKKGLRELVEAGASLHSERPNLHVYMIGEGPDRPIIEGAIQAHNAAGYVHLLPACAFDEVAVWMVAADLVTLPSYMEGCPNVVLEALACGRPVVATSVGGIPEIMSDQCGRLVAPRESGALAQALASVLNGNWDAKAISARAGRSWNTVAAELLEIFESVVSSRQATGDALQGHGR